jgi:hypothetical protein
MAATRPGAGGWSEKGGVELGLPPAPPDPASIEPEPARAAEPASFLEPGETAALEGTGLRPVAGRIARRTEAGPEPAGGALQAWSRLSGRPGRS